MFEIFSFFIPPVSTSWHTEEDSFRAPPIDRSILPTAPRSAREPNVDRSRLPRSPPYTAFLGNLPYDVTEDSIKDFFRGLAVRVASTHICSVGHITHSTLWLQLLHGNTNCETQVKVSVAYIHFLLNLSPLTPASGLSSQRVGLKMVTTLQVNKY